MSLNKADLLRQCASTRVLILDGAMGTEIQKYKLGEADFRGDRFTGWNNDLKGNNDLLSITRPDVIGAIHESFLDAGSDIIETNTFNGTGISQADYAMEALVREINIAGAKVARAAADKFTALTPEKPRFVAGAIGPMNKTLSVSPDVNNPGYRDVTWDEVVASYMEQVEALIEGGVDFFFIETIFDTLNSKAAIFAVQEVAANHQMELPIMLSCTVTDMSGRNLSGQTMEAFWHSVRHAKPLTVGLNCSFGAENLRPHAQVLAAQADTLTCFYPNAGLPNDLGEYDELPEDTARHLNQWAREGLANVLGGCCGTSPDHIRAIAKSVEGITPRQIPDLNPAMRLSGLEPLTLQAGGNIR